MAGSMAPLTVRLQSQQPAVAAGSDDHTNLRAPVAGTVSGVTFTPEAAITGAATNNRTFSLVNRGQAGAGSTVVATITLASGTNFAAYDENTVTLSGTSANLAVAEGDILDFQSIHVGTGIADPGGLVTVTIDR